MHSVVCILPNILLNYNKAGNCMKEKETVGEYFRNLLVEKNVNLTSLAKSAEIKSKNEIYRLYENKYSYEKTKSLLNKILPYIDVSDEELKKFNKLIEYCKTTPSVRQANEILMPLCQAPVAVSDMSFTPVVDFIKEHSEQNVTVFLNTLTNVQTYMFYKAVERADLSRLKVRQIINFNTSDEIIAERLYMFIKLFSLGCYNAYESTVQSDNDIFIIIELDEGFLVGIYDGGKFVTSNVSVEYGLHLVKKYNEQCRKKMKMQTLKFEDYIKLINFYKITDTNNVCSLYGMFCLGDISRNVWTELFKKSSCFGFPENHKYITQLKKALDMRENIKNEYKSTKRYLLNVSQMKKFAETGIMHDLSSLLPALDIKERNEMINMFLKNNSGYMGRAVKNGYKPTDLECVYIDGGGVFCSCYAKNDNVFNSHALINHPKAVRVFKNFVDYIWNEKTYTENETRVMLKKIIQKDI